MQSHYRGLQSAINDVRWDEMKRPMCCGDFVRVVKGVYKEEMSTAHGGNLIDIDDVHKARNPVNDK